LDAAVTSRSAREEAAPRGVVVRDARDDERSVVRDLTRRAYGEYAAIMTSNAWAGLARAVDSALESEAEMQRIVAERDGMLIGSVLLYPPSADAYAGATQRVPWPEIRLLAVAPEGRGQGMGELLVSECVRRARQSGAREIGLHTSASMRSAIRMYERMGFVRASEFDFQPEGGERVEAYCLRLDTS
jgi:ribosomal protein S18 acetylase RimI-like enzyme